MTMAKEERFGGVLRFRPAGGRRWLPLLSRIVAGVVGGYALATLAIASLSTLSFGNRAYGIMGATLGSFAIYTVAILWVFACRDAWRAWGGLGAAALVLALVWLLGWTLGG